MNELVAIKRDDIFTDSWIIAQNIGRDHASITYNIKKFLSRLEKLGPIYSSATRINRRGRPAEIFDLNEQQAIFLMTLLDNSECVLDFKMQLAISFVAMRKLLLEKQTADWQQARLQSKQMRLQETDAIKSLIEYAKAQGSQNADKLYIVYSKLVKQLTGHNVRDMADVDTLTEILTFERLLFGIITSEMSADTYYKEIYKKAKSQLLEIKRLWAMPRLAVSG